MRQHIVILIPVYNDGDCFNILQNALAEKLANPDISYTFLIVNDGSTEPLHIVRNTFFNLRILHLHRNIGHQKALAIGLAYIQEHLPCNKVLVMDSDGEDRPADALKLLYESDAQPGTIVFAHRGSRQENRGFRIFYSCYKLFFRILTGHRISFGHFMVIPATLLAKLVHYSEIWSHLPGTIIRSRLPFTTIQTHRGKRYSGTSKMNFQSLLIHGLGAIAVFIDRIAARLLVFSIALILLSVIAMLAVLAIKLFTDRAIPGWATTVFSSMLIVLLQGFLLSLFTVFLYLSAQSQRKFIPALHYGDYTSGTESIAHGGTV